MEAINQQDMDSMEVHDHAVQPDSDTGTEQDTPGRPEGDPGVSESPCLVAALDYLRISRIVNAQIALS